MYSISLFNRDFSISNERFSVKVSISKDTQTYNKKSLTKDIDTQAFLKTILKDDYVFYKFVRQRFFNIKQKVLGRSQYIWFRSKGLVSREISSIIQVILPYIWLGDPLDITFNLTSIYEAKVSQGWICANITDFTGHYSNINVHEGNNFGLIQSMPKTLILTP